MISVILVVHCVAVLASVIARAVLWAHLTLVGNVSVPHCFIFINTNACHHAPQDSLLMNHNMNVFPLAL